jgi:hypothetical protein
LSVLHACFKAFQTFWTRHEVLTYWTYRVILSKSLELDMKYWQIEQKLWIESPCMVNLSVLHIWFNIWMESSCKFNLSIFHV